MGNPQGCPRATPKGARGGAETPAQVFSSRVEDPLKLGVAKPPQSPGAHDFPKESVVNPFSQKVAEWRNGTFRNSADAESSSPRSLSIAP